MLLSTALVAPHTANAATASWTAGTGDDLLWSDADNWSGASAPGAAGGETATFTADADVLLGADPGNPNAVGIVVNDGVEVIIDTAGFNLTSTTITLGSAATTDATLVFNTATGLTSTIAVQ